MHQTSKPKSVDSDCFIQKQVAASELIEQSKALLDQGFRIALISAQDYKDQCYISYFFLKGNPDIRKELIVSIDKSNRQVPSLGAISFSASRFEREFYDLFGILPLNHPFLRPLVFHGNWPADWHPMAFGASEKPSTTCGPYEFPFVSVEGDGIFEVPVGPIHAGLIEPGHFRFSVVGETIVKMKARLWYLHKGIEKLFEGKTIQEGLKLSELISGDSAVAHSLAFMLALEDCLNSKVDSDVLVGRAQLLELERIYNHITDIGAMCNDVGYSMANSYAQILKEELLNLNLQITGHRLLRGGIKYQQKSTNYEVDSNQIKKLTEQFSKLINLIDQNSNILDRFVGTAKLSATEAKDLNVLGVVARASSLSVDSRYENPFVIKTPGISPITEQSGDVYSRYRVRVEEVFESLNFINNPEVANKVTVAYDSGTTKDFVRCGFGIVEGFRGTVVSRIELDSNNTIKRYKIVDPSFLNWPALSVALKDTIIPDFPLANKSFNLSYSGNDL